MFVGGEILGVERLIEGYKRMQKDETVPIVLRVAANEVIVALLKYQIELMKIQAEQMGDGK